MRKLYVVVRADLEPGDVLAQSNHATSEFAAMHPELHARWRANGKNIVILGIPNEAQLGELVRAAAAAGIPKAEFYEEDLGNELTACAFSDAVSKLVSSLPLALRPARAARPTLLQTG